MSQIILSTLFTLKPQHFPGFPCLPLAHGTPLCVMFCTFFLMFAGFNIIFCIITYDIYHEAIKNQGPEFCIWRLKRSFYYLNSSIYLSKYY